MKHWKKSKLIWLGVLSTALPVIEAKFHLLKSVLSDIDSNKFDGNNIFGTKV